MVVIIILVSWTAVNFDGWAARRAPLRVSIDSAGLFKRRLTVGRSGPSIADSTSGSASDASGGSILSPQEYISKPSGTRAPTAEFGASNKSDSQVTILKLGRKFKSARAPSFSESRRPHDMWPAHAVFNAKK